MKGPLCRYAALPVACRRGRDTLAWAFYPHWTPRSRLLRSNLGLGRDELARLFSFWAGPHIAAHARHLAKPARARRERERARMAEVLQFIRADSSFSPEVIGILR